MKKLIFILLLFHSVTSSSQNADLVFKYLDLKVKSVETNTNENIEYEYKEGVIIEKEKYRNNIVRNYHYTTKGRLDSINYFSYAKSTAITDFEKFTYDKNNRLVKTQWGKDLKREIVRIDSFVYNSKNLIEAEISFRNSKESIFESERIDTLRKYTHINYEYDAESRLIKKVNKNSSNETKYFYDGNNNLLKKIYQSGKILHGDNVEKVKRYSITHYSYNEKGLLEKEITKNYKVNPNGKKRRNGKFKFKKKYTFY